MDHTTRIALALWQRINFGDLGYSQILRREVRNPIAEPRIYLAFHKTLREIIIHLQDIVPRWTHRLRIGDRAGIADL
jgi:hypothetical protein